MSKPDKPIFNQQGGCGKLYGPTHGATYMGTYQMPDGKMDRRMFNCATNKDAIRTYTDWCADMDARILEEMEEKVRPKGRLTRSGAMWRSGCGSTSASLCSRDRILRTS